MTQFVAAIDQGTTSTRCMIFNQRGKPPVRQPDLESQAGTTLFKEWEKAVTRTFDWVE
ncbi:MAG: hypothetical protein J7L35_06455 [Anaerolineales bacterium]|nr:hypothetical protein [Anaerolineales bacterium]